MFAFPQWLFSLWLSDFYMNNDILQRIVTKLKNELGSALYPVSCLLRSEGPAEAGRAYVR